MNNMKIIDYLNILNEKVKIPVKDFIDIKSYYLSMYRYYMLQLYDLGFIDDPTIFNEKLIRQNIIELGIVGMSDGMGRYLLEPNRIVYALHKNTDKSSKDFLSLLYYALLYREYSNSVDNFYEGYSETVKLQLKLSEGRVVSGRNVNLTKANLRLFVGVNKTLKRVGINEYKLFLIFQQLGIPEKDYSIDKDLKYSDLVDMIDIIFGDYPPVELDGEYASTIKDWFKSHNRSIVKEINTFYSLKLLDRLSELANQYELEDIVGIFGTDLYIKKNIGYKKYPLGYFHIIGGHDGDILYDSGYTLNGYTGEGYTYDYLESEGFSVIGVPVELDGEYIYDREQTTIQSESWFKVREDINFFFEEQTNVEIKNEEDAIQSSKEGILGILKIKESEMEEE